MGLLHVFVPVQKKKKIKQGKENWDHQGTLVWIVLLSLDNDRPFPSSCTSFFQSKSWSIAFHMKMSFHSHADKTHFHMKSFVRSLALKKKHKTIWKWPILPNELLCMYAEFYLKLIIEQSICRVINAEIMR